MSLQSMGSGKIDNGLGDMGMSSGGGGGFGGSSGFGLGADVESFSSKPKGYFLFECVFRECHL